MNQRERRVPGGWEERVRMAPDFDQLPVDLLVAFEDESADPGSADHPAQAPESAGITWRPNSSSERRAATGGRSPKANAPAK